MKIVVGKEESTDRKMEIGARKLKIGGKIYKPKRELSFNVYSDARDKDRRDVFVPSAARERYEQLPMKAEVYYSGKWRTANLDFRWAGKDRGSIPVYTFDIK